MGSWFLEGKSEGYTERAQEGTNVMHGISDTIVCVNNPKKMDMQRTISLREVDIYVYMFPHYFKRTLFFGQIG